MIKALKKAPSTTGIFQPEVFNQGPLAHQGGHGMLARGPKVVDSLKVINHLLED